MSAGFSTELQGDLRSIFGKWNARPLFDCLAGKESLFDVDGDFSPERNTWPRSATKAFDDGCFRAGVQALAFLSAHLPEDATSRALITRLQRKMDERLRNPALILFGGFSNQKGGDDAGAWFVRLGQVFFRPARVTNDKQRAFLREAVEYSYSSDIYPWSSLFPVWDTYSSSGFQALLARSGKWDVDPRQSAPAVVKEVQNTLRLDEAPAVLLLQVLALVDSSQADLRRYGWQPAELKQAVAVLVKSGHLVEKKQPRAGRKFVLPGEWDAFSSPHPAIERWKLALYGAESRKKKLAAPLGRLLHLKPLGDTFAGAWKRFAADAPNAPRAVATKHDWIADIRARPDDDAPRLVYADWLIEQGDARGELIRVQCQLARAKTEALVAEEAALLKKHEKRWLADVDHFITGQKWERGFVTHVSAHAQTFVKGADTVFAQLPMLRGFIFDAGADGPVTPASARELSLSPAFARFTELDTTADHYFRSIEHLRQLLDSKHLPKLKRLRIGFHRPGEGEGLDLARMLAGVKSWSDSLEFLELAGQNLGRTAMTNKPVGIEGLELLLHAFPPLKVLRVPYNGFSDADARALAKKLESDSKFAPKLEQVDLTNELDTTFITKAVTFYRNRVTPAGTHVVAAALAKRRGVDLGPAPKAELPKLEKLEQAGDFPFVARAKTGASKCVVCRKNIEAATLRIGVERQLPDVGRITAWLHPDCRTKCPELEGIADLDARLKKNSDRGLWPPPN